MLLDFPIVPERQNEIAGVVHANGTARIQALFERGDNSVLWDLLTLLEAQYGVKALINTSFNSKGEPIVHSEDDARRSARQMKIDAVFLNGKIEAIASE
jgi:carbamoyltransferase